VRGPERLAPIDGSAQFVPANVGTDAPWRRPDERLALEYEVRSPTSRARSLTDDPFAPRLLRPWKVAVNGVALFLVVAITGLVVLGLVPLLWGWQPVVATTGSMAPAVQSSDVVLTSPSRGSELGEGTIVRYRLDDQRQLGRIGAATPDGYFIVQDTDLVGSGDEPVDAEFVAPDSVDGVGVLVIPWIGLPVVWWQTSAWFRLGLLLAAGLGTLYLSRRAWVVPPSEWEAS